MVAPSIKRKEPYWKIRIEDRPAPQQWRVEVGKGNRQTITELLPPPQRQDGYRNPSERSVFTIELTDSCLVGGNPAESGDKVVCYHEAAAMLSGRGRIIEERKNAF